ncbi:hypothetical protein EDB83DRAFT_2629252 [Lactarius deliciosus]|nr:hypothetical protein EDB83DRAFT_2629252 [Lactarius deliciosus]
MAYARFHTSFNVSPTVGSHMERNLFDINHYNGSCSYDVTGFVEKDTNILDSAFVTLLHNSGDLFISKLFAGPSLAAEKHSKDKSMIIQAQVLSKPLHHPTLVTSSNEDHPHLNSSKVYPMTTQLNFALSEIIANLDRARFSPNSFDKCCIKTQICSLLLPNIIRFLPMTSGSPKEHIQQCIQANGWTEGTDFALRYRMIWLAYGAWKTVEDGLRSLEKEVQKPSPEV